MKTKNLVFHIIADLSTLSLSKPGGSKKNPKNLDIWLKTWILAQTKKQWPMAALIKESWLPFVGHTRLIFNLRGNLIFAQPLNSFSIIAKRVTATS